MSNWKDDKVYKLGEWTVHTTEGKATDPRKWYLEIHKDGHYWESRGSNLPFRWLAATHALLSKKSDYSHD